MGLQEAQAGAEGLLDFVKRTEGEVGGGVLAQVLPDNGPCRRSRMTNPGWLPARPSASCASLRQVVTGVLDQVGSAYQLSFS